MEVRREESFSQAEGTDPIMMVSILDRHRGAGSPGRARVLVVADIRSTWANAESDPDGDGWAADRSCVGGTGVIGDEGETRVLTPLAPYASLCEIVSAATGQVRQCRHRPHGCRQYSDYRTARLT
jgi:hypothetical protein